VLAVALHFLGVFEKGVTQVAEKNARQLRALTIAAWLAAVVVAVLGTGAFVNSTPTRGVNAVALLVYVLVAVLGRRAPFLAAAIFLVFANTHIFIQTSLVGTGMGTSLLYMALAGLAFPLLGLERIGLVLFFALVSGVLIAVLEAQVPYNAGVHSPARLYFTTFLPMVATALTIFMATVHYALRTAERAEEALARESRHKSHLIASASHDLRQPLHALNLFVARLRDEPDPAERSRLVARIDASVGSMNELFESLLDMTKLDAGIVEPIPTVLQVQRLFERVETTFGEAARKKGLSLRVVASAAWVASDPILLERVLLNLVSNAVRYTERGGVVVGCRRRGETLRIDICDTGPGIPEDQRSSIFGEFYQLARSEAGRREGLGLGLAIVAIVPATA
jgi:signal transduction histidine kinase